MNIPTDRVIREVDWYLLRNRNDQAVSTYAKEHQVILAKADSCCDDRMNFLMHDSGCYDTTKGTFGPLVNLNSRGQAYLDILNAEFQLVSDIIVLEGNFEFEDCPLYYPSGRCGLSGKSCPGICPDS